MNSDLLETKPDTNPISGGENVDHGLESPDAEIPTAKIRLAVAINNVLRGRKLTQKHAAVVLGITKPEDAALQRYKLDGFSLFVLMRLATTLNFDVVVQLRPKADAKAGGRVMFVATA